MSSRLPEPSFVEACFDYLRYQLPATECLRDVIVTPIASGYVIEVEGTPPRAVIVVIGSERWINLAHAPMCFVHPNDCRVVRWLDPFLGDRRQMAMRSAIVKLLRERMGEGRAV